MLYSIQLKGRLIIMPKYTVNENMGAALRNIRQKRNIKAVTVADYINKTGAYISKLEKGQLNTIDEKDLIGIIRAVSKTEEEFNEAIDLLLADTTKIYSNEENKDEEWRMNMDLFYRHIPIPDEYVDLVNEKITALNISVTEIVDYINANHELYNDETLPNELIERAEKNHWNFNNGRSFIVLEVHEKLINDVISGKAKSANYSLLTCLLLTLYRFEKLSNDEAYKATYETLNRLKIFTLKEKEEIMQAYEDAQNMHTILDQRENPNLSEYDRQLLCSLNELVKKVQFFSELHGADYSCQKVKVMVDNIINDPVLFMGYIGVDLSKLKNCDIQIKKDFVQAIKSLVDEYSVRKPKEEKTELI